MLLTDEGISGVTLGSGLADLPRDWQETVNSTMDTTGCPVGTIYSFDVVRVMLLHSELTVDAIAIGPAEGFRTSIGVNLGDRLEDVIRVFGDDVEFFHLESADKKAASAVATNAAGQEVIWSFVLSNDDVIEKIALGLNPGALGQWCA